MSNPRFLVMMTELRTFDRLTLILAGIVDLAVIGILFLGGRQGRFYKTLSTIFKASVLIAWVMVLAMAAWQSITGG